MTDTRYCTTCGKSNDKGRFCSDCGAPLPEPVAAMSGAAAGRTRSERGRAATAPPPPEYAPLKTPPEPDPGPGPVRAGEQPPPRSWRPLAIASGAVFLTATLVAVLLLALTGSSSDSVAPAAPKVTAKQAALATQNLYAATSRGQYYALLPAGWVKATLPTRPALQDAIAVKSAQDESQTIIVGELAGASGGVSAVAKRYERELTGGATPTYSSVVGFPGARTAWRINWTAGASAKGAYFISSCQRRYLVLGSASAAAYAALKNRLAIVAAGLQAQC